MSFDIHLTCFRNGDALEFSSALIENAFGVYAIKREPRCWVLRYPDGGKSDLYWRPAPMISGFSVNRPCFSPEFAQGLFDILKQTPSALYWSDGCAVVDLAVAPHLPPEMIEALGTPTVVTRPEEIGEAIARS